MRKLIIPLVLAAAALGSCGQDYTAYKASKTLERSVYIHDARVNLCFLSYREPGESRPDLTYVPCTPEVLKIAR